MSRSRRPRSERRAQLRVLWIRHPQQPHPQPRDRTIPRAGAQTACRPQAIRHCWPPHGADAAGRALPAPDAHRAAGALRRRASVFIAAMVASSSSRAGRSVSASCSARQEVIPLARRSRSASMLRTTSGCFDRHWRTPHGAWGTGLLRSIYELDGRLPERSQVPLRTDAASPPRPTLAHRDPPRRRPTASPSPWRAGSCGSGRAT